MRREAKPYGARRQIDGPLDRNSPVVLIDDAISSGTAIRDGIQAVEAAGLVVEGVVAIVDFAAGVVEWLSAAGYRVATVFDVWRDLEMSDQPAPVAVEPTAPGRSDQLPDGLPAAEVAKRVAHCYRTSGSIPGPPAQLDVEYPYTGGVFVSVRRRSDGIRLVRTGLSASRAAEVSSLADAVVWAAYHACRSDAVAAVQDLTDVKFAVSLIGSPEPIQPRDINPRVSGLAARTLGDFSKSGFALPNTPHYDDEVQQLRYAKRTFRRTQPCELFRQTVHRSIEDGQTWPEYGAPQQDSPWPEDPRLAGYFAQVVSQLLSSQPAAAAPTSSEDVRAITPEVVGVGVSVYLERLVGCAVRFGSDIDTVLAEAVPAALADRRYVTHIDAASRCALTTVVSLLYEPRWLGAMSDSRLPRYFRLGRDTLSARGENGSGLVLAQFAAQQGIDENAYCAQVRRKAGQSEGPVRWTAYDTASWVVADGSVRRLEYGLPVRDRFAAEVRDQCVALAGEIAEHVLEMRATDGIPAYTFNMWTGRDSGSGAGTSTRMLIAAGGLLDCTPHLHPNLHDAAAELVGEFAPQAGPGPRARQPVLGLGQRSSTAALSYRCGAVKRTSRADRWACRPAAATHSQRWSDLPARTEAFGGRPGHLVWPGDTCTKRGRQMRRKP